MFRWTFPGWALSVLDERLLVVLKTSLHPVGLVPMHGDRGAPSAETRSLLELP